MPTPPKAMHISSVCQAEAGGKVSYIDRQVNTSANKGELD